MVHHSGETLPAAALTNSVYQDSVKAWQEGRLSNDSLLRFGRAADRVTRFQPTDGESAVEVAFETLAQVSNPSWTMWSIVFDPENLRVSFRTKWNDQIRHLDFSQLDFSCATPVQMLDVHEELSGDVSDDLVPYSRKVSLDHLVNVLGQFGYDTPRDEMAGLLQQMEDYPCLEGKENVTSQASRGSFPWVWPVAAAVVVIVSLAVWYGARSRRLKG
jgi:hypothetical protein